MSDYLEEEEQLVKLKSWWDENGTSLLGAVFVAVVGIVGWNWYGGYSDEQAQAQTAMWQSYSTEAASETRDDEALGNIGAEIADQFSGSAAHAFVLFDQAKSAVDAGEFALAEKKLSTVVAESSDALVVDLARIRLAKVQRQLDLGGEALTTLAGVKNEGYRPLALEIQGDIHASSGEVEQAHLAYQAAVESLAAGDSRPVLEMKLENAKPYDGQYVQMTDQLTEALKQATTALQVETPTEEPGAELEAAPETAEENVSVEAAVSIEANNELEDSILEENTP